MSEGSNSDESILCAVISEEMLTDPTADTTVSSVRLEGSFCSFDDFSTQMMDKNTEHDRILLVQGKELFVQSALLIYSSDFFKVLFGNNFSEGPAKKIELHNVSVEDFILYLYHIYYSNSGISTMNMVQLLVLADRFLNVMMLKKCAREIKCSLHPSVLRKGPEVLSMLKIGFSQNLQDIKDGFRVALARYRLKCKICKRGPRLNKANVEQTDFRPNEYGNPEYQLKGVYLAYDGFCWMNRDEIMNMDTEIVAFIFDCLIESPHSKAYDHSEFYYFENRPLGFGRTFSDRGELDDSAIVVNGRIFHVNSKIVAEKAKWFAGRLLNGCELVIPNVSENDMHLFLNFIYPNDYQIPENNWMALLEMSKRFDCPFLFNWFKGIFNAYCLDYATPETIIRVVEIAVKFNLRELKKKIYKEILPADGLVRCYWPDCNHSNCKPFLRNIFLMRLKNEIKNPLASINIITKIVAEKAKWFAGRLINGCELVIPNVSENDMHLFLNFIYPNDYKIPENNWMALLEMSKRFDCPFLFNWFKGIFNAYCLDYATPETIIRVVEIAVKFNMRELKKKIYKEILPADDLVRCYWPDCNHSNCKPSPILHCFAPGRELLDDHKFRPNGVSHANIAVLDLFTKQIYTRNFSPEAKRFLFSCLVKNIGKFK